MYGRLGAEPPLVDIDAPYFRSNMLLPALAECNPSGLRKLLVTANTAQLERDNKAVRELWAKRSKKLNPKIVGGQVRFHLNFAERCGQRSRQRLEEARRIATEVNTLWDQSEDLFGVEHRDGKSGVRDCARSDAGGQHAVKRRKIEDHLSENDQQALSAGLVVAARAVFADQAGVGGGAGTVELNLLDGL